METTTTDESTNDLHQSLLPNPDVSQIKRRNKIFREHRPPIFSALELLVFLFQKERKELLVFHVM